MDIASFDLCKELYELSGWDDTDKYYDKYGKNFIEPNSRASFDTPAYSLGYLLRKLPKSVKGDTYRLGLVDNVNSYRAGYYNERFWEAYERYGDTPEDAVAKVAITLFRQDILKRD